LISLISSILITVEFGHRSTTSQHTTPWSPLNLHDPLQPPPHPSLPDPSLLCCLIPIRPSPIEVAPPTYPAGRPSPASTQRRRMRLVHREISPPIPCCQLSLPPLARPRRAGRPRVEARRPHAAVLHYLYTPTAALFLWSTAADQQMGRLPRRSTAHPEYSRPQSSWSPLPACPVQRERRKGEGGGDFSMDWVACY
jgi:hypothetical protein